MHCSRELLTPALHDHVEVRAKEAPSEQPHIEAIRRLPEEQREGSAIEIVEKDVSVTGTSACDVVDPIGKVTSQSARHQD
jgi:hypothetical protein